jgi:DNA-binding response OmpR family regulator
VAAHDALNRAGVAGRQAGSAVAAGAPILVVEDDEDLRRLIHRVLDRQGYAVRAVAQGAALRAALRQAPRPRLMLIDAELDLRRHAWCMGIPVVYLSKPFSIDALRATVREALQAAA